MSERRIDQGDEDQLGVRLGYRLSAEEAHLLGVGITPQSPVRHGQNRTPLEPRFRAKEKTAVGAAVFEGMKLGEVGSPDIGRPLPRV
jgi:hypothetical protein